MIAVLFHAEVAKDLREATRWYEQRRKGLGAEFRSSFEEMLNRIAASPLRFAPVHAEVRCARLPRFPYGIFYELVREGVLVVFAVSHHSRDPGSWKQRL